MSDCTSNIRIYGPLPDLEGVLKRIRETKIGNIEWEVSTFEQHGEMVTEVQAVGEEIVFDRVGKILIEVSKESGCRCEQLVYTEDDGPYTTCSRYEGGVVEVLLDTDLLFAYLSVAIDAHQALDGDAESAGRISGEFAVTTLYSDSWSYDVFSMLSLVSILCEIDYYPSPEHAEGWLKCIESIKEMAEEDWEDRAGYFESAEDEIEMLKSRAQAALLAKNSGCRLAEISRSADCESFDENAKLKGDGDDFAIAKKYVCAM